MILTYRTRKEAEIVSRNVDLFICTFCSFIHFIHCFSSRLFAHGGRFVTVVGSPNFHQCAQAGFMDFIVNIIDSAQGPVSRRSRQLFGPEKPFVRLQPAYSVKLVLSDVVKGMKMKIWTKCRASRSLRFKDTKRIMPPEMHPKSLGTFEKQAPGLPHLPKAIL